MDALAPEKHLVRVVAAGLFLVGVFMFAGVTIDDAYISARYAKNLVDGHGLVFNPGERVEGFSNPLWVFLLAALHALGADLVAAGRGLGVGATLGAFYLMNRAWRGTTASSRFAPLALLPLAAAPEVAFWSLAGLETTLYSLLVLALAIRLGNEETESGPPLSAVLAGGCALARPEGVMFFGLVLLAKLVAPGRDFRRRLLDGAWCSLAFVLTAGPYFAFRLHYFGELVPNTFLVKAGGLDRLPRGARYLGSLLVTPSGAVTTLLGLAAVPLARRTPVVRALLAAALVEALFVLWAGGDWMPLGRFAVPLMFLLAAAGGHALSHYAPEAGASLRSSGRKLALVAALVALLLAQAWVVKRARAEYFWRSAHGLDSRVAFGRWLESHAPKDLAVACGDVGALPFFSERRVIDTNGLVDREIARLLRAGGPEREAAVARSVAGRAPGLVLVVTLERPPAAWQPAERETRELLRALGSAYERRADLTLYPPNVVPGYPKGRFAVVLTRRGVALPGIDEVVHCSDDALARDVDPSSACVTVPKTP